MARDKMRALNLGMREVVAGMGAASYRVTNFVKSLEVGSIPMEQSLNTLMTGLTEAGARISEGDFAAAVGDAADLMRRFGATDKEIDKFTEGLKATHHLQRNMDDIFNVDFIGDLQKELAAGNTKGLSGDELRKKFADSIGKQLEGAGFSEDIQKQFKTMIKTGKISQEDLMQFVETGDFSVITKNFKELTEAQQKVLKETMGERIKIEKQLIALTKKRIAAERKFEDAQRKAIDIQLEASEIAAKHGGAAVSPEMRRQAILDKANVGAKRLGIANMGGANPAALRNRNAAIMQRFGNLEMRGRQEHGFAGGAGVEAAAARDDLMKAQQQQIQTIKNLIKVDEQALKIIEKKNQLEKDSLKSLIKGDLDKFLEGQAAVGATAAVSTGDERLMGLFGAEALGGAFENIKKQQDAGVQSIFGQRLGGAGGLSERAAGAALSSRGLDDFGAAQTMAGTTPEEEKIRSRIRGMAGVLGETGQMGADMANMQVKTATINVQNATIKAAATAEAAKRKMKEEGREVQREQYQQSTLTAAERETRNRQQRVGAEPGIATNEEYQGTEAAKFEHGGETYRHDGLYYVGQLGDMGESSPQGEKDARALLAKQKPTGPALARANAAARENPMPDSEFGDSFWGRAKAEGLFARGGFVYGNRGMFVPRGTDTVPAMLTPGEFVVRRSSVERGNNLQLLHAINNGRGSQGYARGGPVQYLAEGGVPAGGGLELSITNIDQFSNAFKKFNNDLANNITSLKHMQLKIKLDTTNVNVNLSGTGFLSQLRDGLKEELLQSVGDSIKDLKFLADGTPQTGNSSVLG